MYAVAIDTHDGRPGAPRPLFDRPYLAVEPGDAHYDAAPDGRGLLLIANSPAVQPSTVNIVVVLNWHEELERLVPTN